jgi:hypothetical protein
MLKLPRSVSKLREELAQKTHAARMFTLCAQHVKKLNAGNG